MCIPFFLQSPPPWMGYLASLPHLSSFPKSIPSLTDLINLSPSIPALPQFPHHPVSITPSLPPVHSSFPSFSPYFSLSPSIPPSPCSLPPCLPPSMSVYIDQPTVQVRRTCVSGSLQGMQIKLPGIIMLVQLAVGICQVEEAFALSLPVALLS